MYDERGAAEASACEQTHPRPPTYQRPTGSREVAPVTIAGMTATALPSTADRPEQAPRYVRVVWKLAPAVASALYQLAEWRHLDETHGELLTELLGPALAAGVLRQVDELFGPLSELPSSVGPDYPDPENRPVLVLPDSLTGGAP